MEPGLQGTAQRAVDSDSTAKAMGSGSLDVLATPAMIALMEAAAVDAVKEVLEAGMTTVGTQLTVSHLAATPVGMHVTAKATLTAVEKGGRLLTFEVEATDDTEVVGKGTHQRFVVAADKFSAKAAAKAST